MVNKYIPFIRHVNRFAIGIRKMKVIRIRNGVFSFVVYSGTIGPGTKIFFGILFFS